MLGKQKKGKKGKKKGAVRGGRPGNKASRDVLRERFGDKIKSTKLQVRTPKIAPGLAEARFVKVDYKESKNPKTRGHMFVHLEFEVDEWEGVIYEDVDGNVVDTSKKFRPGSKFVLSFDMDHPDEIVVAKGKGAMAGLIQADVYEDQPDEPITLDEAVAEIDGDWFAEFLDTGGEDYAGTPCMVRAWYGVAAGTGYGYTAYEVGPIWDEDEDEDE